MLANHVERALTYAPLRYLPPSRAQPNLHRCDTLSFLTQQPPGCDAAILQGQLVSRFAADHRALTENVEAGGVAVDEESPHASTGAFLPVGDRPDDREIGFCSSGDSDLAAVDHPVLTVAVGARRHRG